MQGTTSTDSSNGVKKEMLGDTQLDKLKRGITVENLIGTSQSSYGSQQQQCGCTENSEVTSKHSTPEATRKWRNTPHVTPDLTPNGSLDLNGLTQMEHNNTPSIGSILEQLLEEDEIQLTQESEQEGNREIYNSTWRQSGTD